MAETRVEPVPRATTPAGRRRWWILATLGLAQLMIVLDMTVVTVALPHAQDALGFADATRQWIISAYSLAFGSLLVVGGKVGDLFGRRGSLMIGVVGFALASAAGGAAQGVGVLIAARTAQGVFAALMAPAALALLAGTFAGSRDRGKAFGIFSAIAGAGGAIGLLLGGVLTEYASWRWCLYINVPIAAAIVVGLLAVVPAGARRHGVRIDHLGSLVVSGALFCIVYGLANSETNGWRDWATLTLLAAGVALLGAFVLVESRSPEPLLPLSIVRDRTRGGAYLSMVFSAVGLFGVFLFLTYFVQQILGYSPVRAGFAFVPQVVVTGTVAALTGARLLGRVGPKVLVPTGMALSACGLLLYTRLDTDTTYLTGIVPSLLLMGLGLGPVFSSAFSLSAHAVHGRDSGVASSLVNVAQQVGGAVGVALLSSVAATAATRYVDAHRPGPAQLAWLHAHPQAVPAVRHALEVDAQLAAAHSAFAVAAGVFAVGAIVAGLLYPRKSAIGL